MTTTKTTNQLNKYLINDITNIIGEYTKFDALNDDVRELLEENCNDFNEEDFSKFMFIGGHDVEWFQDCLEDALEAREFIFYTANDDESIFLNAFIRLVDDNNDADCFLKAYNTIKYDIYERANCYDDLEEEVKVYLGLDDVSTDELTDTLNKLYRGFIENLECDDSDDDESSDDDDSDDDYESSDDDDSDSDDDYESSDDDDSDSD